MADKASWHLDYLDALRGIAVLGVVLVHSSLTLPLGHIGMLAFTGQRGVQLFFVVSAFTLFLSHDNRRGEHNPTLNFFLRRFFRFAPMFYISVSLTYFLMRQYVGPARDIVLSVFFLHGFLPSAIVHGPAGGWSVATEAIFYMCLPMLFRKITSLNRALWCLLISAPVLYLTTQTMAYSRAPEQAEYLTFFGFPVEFPVFAMGIVSYFFWKNHIAGAGQESKHTSLILLSAALGLWVIGLPFNNRGLYFTSAACALLMISLSIRPWDFLVNRLTKLLGRVSYSIYLLHFFVLQYVRRAIEHRTSMSNHPLVVFVATFFVTLIITIPISFLSWNLIEKPGIRLGQRVVATLESGVTRKKDANYSAI